MNTTCLRIAVIVVAFMLSICAADAAYGDIVVKSGEKVAFLGDSITAQGWTSPHGYVRLAVAGLQTAGVKIEPIPAGIGGHRSNDMLARLKRDVLDKKPDWVTISCGMNDVIHGDKGVPLEQYKINMASMIDQCQSASIKVILFTTTTCGAWTCPQSVKLGQYSEFLRELAGRKKCILVDLFPAFVEHQKTSQPLRSLTYDGVHMAPEGNMLMARMLLGALGCSDEQIGKAQEVWMDLPNAGNFTTRVDIELNKKFFGVSESLTLRQRERVLDAVAAAKKPTLMHWSKELLMSLIKKKVKPIGAYDSMDALFVPGAKEKVQAELQLEFSAEISQIVNAGPKQ